GPPLHAAAAPPPGRPGDESRELLPVLAPRRGRPPDRRPRPRAGGLRLMADDFYREIILDHYKSPRSHGEIADPTATAEGQNPLCGDEVTMYLKLGADGQTIERVSFT